MSEKLPQALDAEKAVLGSMMLSQPVAAKAAELLRRDDFYRPANGCVFAAIASAVLDGDPSDALAISTRLEESGELSRVGGASALHDMISVVVIPSVAEVEWFAAVIRARARMRALVAAGTAITSLGYDLDRDPADAASLAAKILADATVESSNGTGLTPFDEIAPSALEAIEANRGGKMGVTTGITAFDSTVGGLRAGQLIIVGARPSMGKSILGVEWARHVAMQGKTAAIFSLEMSREEIFNRIASASASIPLQNITRNTLSQNEWNLLAQMAVRRLPLHIDDTAPMTVNDIVYRARRLHQTRPLSLIVVDYMQLLTTSGKSDNRQQEVSEISRTLKLLARELECPVVALSQLNRGPEMRPDKRPNLADLRESGAVEQDADIVVLLYRDDYYNRQSDRGKELDLLVAKHRNGRVGTIVTLADFEHARVLDLPPVALATVTDLDRRRYGD